MICLRRGRGISFFSAYSSHMCIRVRVLYEDAMRSFRTRDYIRNVTDPVVLFLHMHAVLLLHIPSSARHGFPHLCSPPPVHHAAQSAGASSPKTTSTSPTSSSPMSSPRLQKYSATSGTPSACLCPEAACLCCQLRMVGGVGFCPP